MSDSQKHAQLHALFGFMAGAGAIGLDWLLGALTNHTLNIPVGLAPLVPLFTALITYTLTMLKQYTEQPAQPPMPPAPPAG